MFSRRKVCVWRDHSTPLNYPHIVLRLQEIGEIALDGMITSMRKDFPTRLCREVASCTQGRVMLFLTKPGEPGPLQLSSDAEKQTLLVQYGRKTYGTLIFSLFQQEPALQEQEFIGTRSLAKTCADLLRHFELASLVFNGSPLTVTSLTRRQLQVLRLICQSCSLSEIARQLHIKLVTVEKHRQHIYAKLEVGTDLDIPLIAFRAGLFSPLSDTQNTSDQNLP